MCVRGHIWVPTLAATWRLPRALAHLAAVPCTTGPRQARGFRNTAVRTELRQLAASTVLTQFRSVGPPGIEPGTKDYESPRRGPGKARTGPQRATASRTLAV